MNRLTLVLVVLCLVVASGCRHPEDEVRILEDSNSVRDASERFDDTSEGEAGGTDTAGKPDTGSEQENPLIQCSAGFRHAKELSCSEHKWKVSAADKPFKKPENRTILGPPPSKQEVLERFGDGPRGLVTSVHPGQHLMPSKRLAFDLYAETDEPFTVNVGFVLPDSWTYEDMSLFVSIFKDYRPVEATFRVMNDANDEVVESFEAKGRRLPFDDRFLFVEAEIPAEEFPEKRGYEIALGFVAYSEKSGVSFSDQSRFWLHHGGLEPPRPERCSRASRRIEWDDTQYELARKLHDRQNKSLAIPKGVTTQEEVREYPKAYEVDEDCVTVQARVSSTDDTRYTEDFTRVRTVAVPVVNWTPLAEQLHFDRSVGDGRTIDGLLEKDVPVPKGGETTAFFLVWPSAYIPFREVDGTENLGVDRGSTILTDIVKLKRPAE